MAAVTLEILHNDVCAVWLERHAVIAIIDMAILNDNIAAPVCIPSIGVLRRVVALTEAANRDVAENDVGRVRNEVVVLRGVAEVEVGDGATMQTDSTEKDWTEDVDILGVEVVPDLTITVNGAAAINIYVCPAKLKEGGGVLEGLVEGVLLPVVGIIGELNVTLDVWTAMLGSRLRKLSQRCNAVQESLPISMAFKKVRSSAVPMTYWVPCEKMTWPPLLHL